MVSGLVNVTFLAAILHTVLLDTVLQGAGAITCHILFLQLYVNLQLILINVSIKGGLQKTIYIPWVCSSREAKTTGTENKQ